MSLMQYLRINDFPLHCGCSAQPAAKNGAVSKSAAEDEEDSSEEEDSDEEEEAKVLYLLCFLCETWSLVPLELFWWK